MTSWKLPRELRFWTWLNLYITISSSIFINTSVIHLWFWCCIQNFWLYGQESPQGHRHNMDTFLLWKVFLVPKMENFIQSIPITWTSLYNEQFLTNTSVYTLKEREHKALSPTIFKYLRSRYGPCCQTLLAQQKCRHVLQLCKQSTIKDQLKR